MSGRSVRSRQSRGRSVARGKPRFLDPPLTLVIIVMIMMITRMIMMRMMMRMRIYECRMGDELLARPPLVRRMITMRTIRRMMIRMYEWC